MGGRTCKMCPAGKKITSFFYFCICFSVCSSFSFDSLFLMDESAVVYIWTLLWSTMNRMSLSLCVPVFFFCKSAIAFMKHDARCTLSLCCTTTSFINMHFGPAAPVCSPCHPVVLICCSLCCQVSFRSLVQSVSPVLLEDTLLSGTEKTAAISATETADQVKKLWVISTKLTVSSNPSGLWWQQWPLGFYNKLKIYQSHSLCISGNDIFLIKIPKIISTFRCLRLPSEGGSELHQQVRCEVHLWAGL